MVAARVLVFIVARRFGMSPPAHPLHRACDNTLGNVSLTTKKRRPPVLSVVLRFLRRTSTSSSAKCAARMSSELDTCASMKPPLRHSCFLVEDK